VPEVPDHVVVMQACTGHGDLDAALDVVRGMARDDPVGSVLAADLIVALLGRPAVRFELARSVFAFRRAVSEGDQSAYSRSSTEFGRLREPAGDCPQAVELADCLNDAVGLHRISTSGGDVERVMRHTAVGGTGLGLGQIAAGIEYFRVADSLSGADDPRREVAELLSVSGDDCSVGDVGDIRSVRDEVISLLRSAESPPWTDDFVGLATRVVHGSETALPLRNRRDGYSGWGPSDEEPDGTFEWLTEPFAEISAVVCVVGAGVVVFGERVRKINGDTTASGLVSTSQLLEVSCCEARPLMEEVVFVTNPRGDLVMLPPGVRLSAAELLLAAGFMGVVGLRHAVPEVGRWARWLDVSLLPELLVRYAERDELMREEGWTALVYRGR
jgi:hypothetical protein